MKKTLITIALALTLTACTNTPTNETTPQPNQPTEQTKTQETEPKPTPPHLQTPEERIRASFAAHDETAAQGFKDLSYIDEYYVPEVAELVRKDNQHNADIGAKIIGERKLSRFTTIEETDTTAIIEFCNDARDRKAYVDDEEVNISNSSPLDSAARFTLIRQTPNDPWLISEKGYYNKKEVGSCENYFGH